MRKRKRGKDGSRERYIETDRFKRKKDRKKVTNRATKKQEQ